jgi:CheY-like chemotaxis protein
MNEKILIVEDYTDTRFLMRILLESFGYEVLEAADGLEAVESIKNQLPDLILMDISLPFMDGLTATKVIRSFDGTSKIPIIAVTAFGNSLYKKAIEAGCDDLIKKPLDFDNLEPIINEYLNH